MSNQGPVDYSMTAGECLSMLGHLSFAAAVISGVFAGAGIANGGEEAWIPVAISSGAGGLALLFYAASVAESALRIAGSLGAKSAARTAAAPPTGDSASPSDVMLNAAQRLVSEAAKSQDVDDRRRMLRNAVELLEQAERLPDCDQSWMREIRGAAFAIR